MPVSVREREGGAEERLRERERGGGWGERNLRNLALSSIQQNDHLMVINTKLILNLVRIH